MPHYVFLDHAGRPLGVAVNTTKENAERLADDLTAERETEQGLTPECAPVTVTEIRAFAPKPVKEGSVVSGTVAMTLPRGTGIVRIEGRTGMPVHPSSALLKTKAGYIGGCDVPGDTGDIDESSRYRVWFLGKIQD